MDWLTKKAPGIVRILKNNNIVTVLLKKKKPLGIGMEISFAHKRDSFGEAGEGSPMLVPALNLLSHLISFLWKVTEAKHASKTVFG